MILREREQKAIDEKISEFHYYLDNGVPVEKAKEIILKSTCLKPIIDYVSNHK